MSLLDFARDVSGKFVLSKLLLLMRFLTTQDARHPRRREFAADGLEGEVGMFAIRHVLAGDGMNLLTGHVHLRGGTVNAQGSTTPRDACNLGRACLESIAVGGRSIFLGQPPFLADTIRCV